MWLRSGAIRPNGRARSLWSIRHGALRAKSTMCKSAKTTSRRGKGRRFRGIKGAFNAAEGRSKPATPPSVAMAKSQRIAESRMRIQCVQCLPVCHGQPITLSQPPVEASALGALSASSNAAPLPSAVPLPAAAVPLVPPSIGSQAPALASAAMGHPLASASAIEAVASAPAAVRPPPQPLPSVDASAVQTTHISRPPSFNETRSQRWKRLLPWWLMQIPPAL